MGLPSKKWETINPTINGCFISCPSRLLHFSHGCNFALYWVKKISGIMPDVMHITHLALLPDVITSLLLDWSDDRKFWSATSREGRLNQMWQSYRSCVKNKVTFCGIGHRGNYLQVVCCNRIPLPMLTSLRKFCLRLLHAIWFTGYLASHASLLHGLETMMI